MIKAKRRRFSFWDVIFGSAVPRIEPPIESLGDQEVSDTLSEIRRARRAKKEMQSAFENIAHDMRNEEAAARPRGRR